MENLKITLETTIGRFESAGYRLFPSTRQYIADEIRKAVASGTIGNTMEVRRAVAVWLVTAAQKRVVRHGTVKVRHLREAWMVMRVCPGNSPPHKCLRRSTAADSLRSAEVGYESEGLLDRLLLE